MDSGAVQYSGSDPGPVALAIVVNLVESGSIGLHSID